MTSAEETNRRDGADEPATSVHHFIVELVQRYRTLRDGGTTALPDATADERLTELMLADAALRYARPATGVGASSTGNREKRPLQVAVLGPTQTGKSTIVNLILGAHAAEVSPLAGFTTHPQGFWIGAHWLETGATSGLDEPVAAGPRAGREERLETGATGAAEESWISELFPGWQRCVADELSRDELEQYALTSTGETPVPPPTGETRVPHTAPIVPAGLPPCVVWDTPDFDTLAAHTYRRGVLEVAALADAHVFVLSKEKYCDLSVWRVLRLLQPLARPLLICLNKLTPEAVEPVTAALKQRLAEMGGRAATAPLVTFEYQAGFDATAELSALPEVWQLRDLIARRLKVVRAADRSAGLRAFVLQHWSDWTAPVEVELAAVRAWNERVADALREARECYRRDFLNHPQRFDTFRRATVELLHLLELPGLANVLSQVRHVLSWPARRLFAARQAWSARRYRKAGIPRGLGSEEVVLFELIEKLLTSLERDAARRSDATTPGHAVWRALAKRLEQQHARLRTIFQTAAQQQRDDFAPVIHATASRLYEALQERPALLNTLRAARATSDVAAIALALKLGGLGLNDLLFAPAMFALISMLTEGALGSYMTHVADDLKKQQLEHVGTRLIEGVFARELRDLAVDLKGAGLFGIPPQRLRAATQALDAWEHSDDE